MPIVFEGGGFGGGVGDPRVLERGGQVGNGDLGDKEDMEDTTEDMEDMANTEDMENTEDVEDTNDTGDTEDVEEEEDMAVNDGEKELTLLLLYFNTV